jgi:hypothetical protein
MALLQHYPLAALHLPRPMLLTLQPQPLVMVLLVLMLRGAPQLQV